MQPLVSIDCREGSNDHGLKEWTYRFNDSKVLASNTNLVLRLPHFTSTQLIDLPDTDVLNKDLGISVARVIADTVKSFDGPINHLCLLNARWIPSTAWVATPYQTVLQAPTADSVDPSTKAPHGAGIPNGTLISLDPRLLNQMIVSLPERTLMGDITVKRRPQNPDNCEPEEEDRTAAILTHIHEHCNLDWYFSTTKDRTTGYPSCVATAAALILTDILRNVPSGFSNVWAREGRDGRWSFYPASYVTTEIRPTPPAGNFTIIGLQFSSETHAYRLEGLLMYLAGSVLVLHFLIAWVQSLLLLFGECWHSRAWSELGEVLTLGVATPVPDGGVFENVGGGVMAMKIWGLRTFIKAGAATGQARLVFVEGRGRFKGTEAGKDGSVFESVGEESVDVGTGKVYR